MGMQDRDYYREHWQEKRAQEGRKPKRAGNPFTQPQNGLWRWFLLIVGCLAAYGFVAMFRDIGRLLRDLPL